MELLPSILEVLSPPTGLWASESAVVTVGDDSVSAVAGARAYLNITYTSTVEGTFNLLAASTLRVTNAAIFWLTLATSALGDVQVDANAAIVVQDTSSAGYTQNSNTTFTLNGYITVAAFLNEGLLQGNGAINGTLTNAGTISPGSSPGTMFVNGDYHQSSTGTYQFEIASSTNYDRIIISGTAYRAGILYIDLLNGYIPKNQEAFQIMTHEHAQGTYSIVHGNDDSTFFKFGVTYGDTITSVTYNNSAMSSVPPFAIILVIACIVSAVFL